MAQHDYVIDNSTGANVRADINNALLAISSTNSGSSAPSTTYAFQLFANTTTSKLQIRNAANNAFVDLIGLDGTILLADGSVSSPSLAFSDDLNTGIFSSADDTFNVATAGVERMELGGTTIFNEDGADVDFRIEGDTDANLFYVDAGNNRIGIGTASPASTLDVNGDISISSSHPRIFFTDSNGNPDYLIDVNGGHFLIHDVTNAADRLKINSSGNVGIGTTSPGNVLDVRGSGHSKILVGTTGTGHATGLQISHAIGDGALQEWQLQTDATADGNLTIRNATSGNKIMIFDADVYGVSIGGLDPENMFELGGSNNTKTDPLQVNNILRFRDNDSTSTSGQPMGTIIWTTGDSGNAGVSGYISCESTSNDGRGRMNFAAGSEANGTLTEVMHIDGEGVVMGGTALAGDFGTESLRVNATNRTGIHAGTHDSNGVPIRTNRSDARATYTAMAFHAQGVQVGSVVANFSSTNFNTSSDYRIKENVVNLENAINRLKNLKPYRFNFIGDTSGTIDGFFAHEAAEVVPNAVTGEKDAVKDGEIDAQSMDNSKLVPLLVAAVQELIGKVEALEAA